MVIHRERTKTRTAPLSFALLLLVHLASDEASLGMELVCSQPLGLRSRCCYQFEGGQAVNTRDSMYESLLVETPVNVTIPC